VLEADAMRLPFGHCSFDLVASRHPVATAWFEIARVLAPGGTYFSQQVGPGSVRELTDFMMGPQPVNEARSAERASKSAKATGFVVCQIRRQSLETVFYDVAAVVHFLRKVPWIVPGFNTRAYRDRLEALHALIQDSGSFVAHAQSFLIEATRRE
jgi:SAM-dependent methyltransferase